MKHRFISFSLLKRVYTFEPQTSYSTASAITRGLYCHTCTHRFTQSSTRVASPKSASAPSFLPLNYSSPAGYSYRATVALNRSKSFMNRLR